MDRAETAKIITAQLEGVPMKESELPQFLMMYIMDQNFDRAGICEAEKMIRRERGWE